MNQYVITAPNGKKYKVTGENPEGALATVEAMLAEQGAKANPTAVPADEIAAFDRFNPALAGKFASPDQLPEPGQSIIAGPGGGGRSGAPRVSVNLWKPQERVDYMRLPFDANPETDRRVKSSDSDEPLYQTRLGTVYSIPKVYDVPREKSLGDVPLSDIGGAVKNMATGLVSAVGQGITAPGRALKGEPVTMGDVLATASLMVPDAPATPARPELPPASLSSSVEAAKSRGIPVYRTDVAPPKTFLGKNVQRVGESIPLAGTGRMRAGQQQARIDAAANFIKEYGGDAVIPALDDVTSDLLAKRSADVGRWTKQKTEVIDRLGGAPVPTPNAVKAIDAQIAKLQAQNLPKKLGPVIDTLKEWRAGLANQPLDVIEANRKVIGEAFTAPELASIRKVGEKALAAIYGPLRDDMGAFIKANGKPGDFAKWKFANDRLSGMADELGNTALKRALNKGEMTPEDIRGMLFSRKPSDVALLYRNLTPQGQARARTAIIQEVVEKAGGIEAISPEKFVNAIGRLGPQVKGFFKANDLEAVTGLVKALKLTRRAADAVASPPTGVQNLPAILGFGGLGAATVLGPKTVIGTGVTIGMAARIYESTGVKAALRRLAKAENPQTQTIILQQLDDVLKGMAAPIGASGAANKGEGPRQATYR